ncbi:helix-turn-helix transcriptional regulator [Kitasatospora sp. NBC_01250]|uniref:AraC family transcriptional regulator n=1 Tax=unclassified Kitasatospora TaxID=2633591 RepID=UPI002E13504B|nr:MULTISPECIES: helix-turn-helix transcriptional regulator [unclassified Kitasatospora]WSJ71458.1 helix-turn-helix transcriptional regulator [Kitasatospora sp. NBC_01302]
MVLSPLRDSPAVGAIVVNSSALPTARWLDEHRHSRHQLAWAAQGVLGVKVGEDSWVLPPTRALWIPSGVPHRTGATRDAVFHSLYLEPADCPLTWDAPVAVAVDDLLAQLLRHLGRSDLTEAARRRAEAVVFDLLHPLPSTPIRVPDPTDDRARAVAAILLADPADSRTLDGFARATGTSRRTLSRIFVQDTGMTFDHWRTQLRLRAALPMLAEGHPVARVARAVGYATPSAFLAAFRRTVGTSPQRYLAGA